MPDASFGPVAPYYDELMRSVPYRMWTSYYLLLLAHQGVRPTKVLDVCCGTGTMCEMLVEEGKELSGFDLSPGMIERAREKAAKKKLDIRYEVADARTVDMGEQYDAAFSFFDSLNNILEPEGLFQSFQRVAEHLPSGGSWIFDLNTAYAFEEQMFDQHSGPRAKLKYNWIGTYDKASRIITVDMHFEYKGEEFYEVHRQRAHPKDEVESMLKEAGFGEIRAFHSYTLNPVRLKSDRIHYTCIRE
ncbi:class I SAM-dependent methyltransferase [bacterium]|nr:MAG: class I SAM-dependent methyltransferase [bacterium]